MCFEFQSMERICILSSYAFWPKDYNQYISIPLATHTSTICCLVRNVEMSEMHQDFLLKHLASVLGVTDTSLSRLRRSKMLYAGTRQNQF